MDHLGLYRCPVPRQLFDPEEEEQEIDDVDGDQLLHQLTGNVATILKNIRTLARLHVTKGRLILCMIIYHCLLRVANQNGDNKTKFGMQ